MRDKTLGRWIVRLAVTIGVGSMALGLSAAAANADDSSAFGRSRPGLVGTAQLSSAAPEHIFVTEDFSWD
ncbi:hypothetical protein ACQP00_49550 [Dactylosporangium sp. CS-047395]|jgi:hypothetical protein|uniref:hypothetical protein n=1 Tax=Dactylosporangium sp. CS-047395 TaxID=3239936 RepID=UPI003D8C63F0